MKILRIPLVIVLILAGRSFSIKAQSVTNLASSPFSTESLVSGVGIMQGSDGNFYGVTMNGGTSSNCTGGCGTIFRISPDGVYTTLYSFVNSPDGSSPQAAPLLLGPDGNYYGTTRAGGAYGLGTVFRMNSNGNETNLYSFGGSSPDGASPEASLVLGVDSNFYGTTFNGGSHNHGTVFRVTPSGSESNLYNFGDTPNDGSGPAAALLLASDGNFYGATTGGGTGTQCSAGCGMIFRVSPAGLETNLHSCLGTATDGDRPSAPLIQASDGNLYGTEVFGGAPNNGEGGGPAHGAIFRVTLSGAYSIFRFFNNAPSEGIFPDAPLMQASDGFLYGTTSQGGTHTAGNLFRISLAGSDTNLYSFGGFPNDGTVPSAGLVQGNDGNLYGITQGGTSGNGVIFRLTLPQTFRITSIAKVGNNIRVAWQASEGTTNVVQAARGGANGGYSNNFADLSPLIGMPLGLTSTNYLDIGGATNQPSRFYRVRMIGLDSPIAVFGYNRDVVVERTATGTDTAPYAMTFDADNNISFYEAGLNATTFTGGNPTTEGLPQGGTFTSILDGTTTFQLGPYTGNNVLYMNTNSPSATLTLAAPTKYNSLSVLATSANGGGTGSCVIHFTDSTSSSPISFNAPDWFGNPGAALTHFGRIYCGNFGAFLTDDHTDNNPNLYQTEINLIALGLNTKPIASITFTMPNGPGTFPITVTGVFALSGSPVK